MMTACVLKDLPLVERAVVFAAVKHAGTLRKNAPVPCIAHAVEAMTITAGMTDDPEVLAAAVLHDTLEDTATVPEELEGLFGRRVRDLVAAETEDRGRNLPGAGNWAARKGETVGRLMASGTDVRMVALGDKLSNLRALRRDLMRLGGRLWEKFHQKDPAMQGMYYQALKAVFAADPAIRDTQACREYMDLAERVFGG